MAHIHTNPGEHDATASAFIARTDMDQPRVLLHKHKKLGILLQPGGHVELTETPWQAVCHEIAEETGYSFNQLKILQPKLRIKNLTGAVLHPQPIVHNTHNFGSDGTHRHTDISYAFVANGDPLGQPADGESAEYRWVSLNDLKALSRDEIPANVRTVCKFVLTDILTQWVPVETAEFKL